jgi:hypothetical protein
MRLLTLFFLLAASVALNAQLTDDFSDGDFTANPEWTGTTENFIVNGDNELQLNDDEPFQSYLSTSFSAEALDAKEWNFRIRQSFSPSSNNYSRVYLSAQQPVLTFDGNSAAGAQGYFLLFGESGSDDAIRLFRDDNTGDAPVEIAAGTAGLVAGSFNIRVRVLRDASGNWQLFVDPDGGTQYQLEATGTDATYNTTSHFGWVCTYTVSNADNFFLDDVYFGDPFVDEEAPVAVSAEALDANTVAVTFNEPIDAASAAFAANYSVNEGIGAPQTAQLDGGDPTVVNLSFAANLPENTALELTVEGVEDLSGNASESTVLPFIYVVSASAAPGDVVFNEIFPDPNPPLGLPEFEFVELYNASDNAFDLANWEFVNSTTVKVLPAQALLPGEFVILCDADAADAFSVYGPVIPINSFTALSNSGDSLTLISNEGTILDIVAYTDDWYGDPAFDDGGITLERINPSAGCSGAANWSASQSFQGGTPGAQNSIFDDTPDTTPPSFEAQSFPEDNVIILQFDERLLSGLPDQLTINLTPAAGGFTANLVNSDSALRLEFVESFAIGTDYTLTIEGITDCTGNTQTEVFTLEFARGAIPEVGDLLITEIMAAPSSELPSPNAEYIEVFNRGESLLELTDLELSGATFTEQVLLAPGEYLILTDEEDLGAFLLFPNTVGMVGFPGLTNSGRELVLSDAELNIIDQVNYDDSWYGDPAKDDGGFSLELINPDDPCSDGDNWTASNANTGHTAGAENSVFDTTPDETPPQLLYALVSGANTVDLYYNEQLDEVTENVIEVEVGIVEGNVYSPLGYTQEDITFPTADRKVLRVTFDGGFSAGIIYLLRSNGAVDCWGNMIGSGVFDQQQFAVPEEMEEGDLVINEVLFDPYQGGTDFVEIYNRSQKNLSIQNVLMANEDDGIPDNFSPVTDIPRIIYPGEYFVFTESVVGVTAFYENAVENRIVEVDDLPSYNNGDGVVILADTLFTIFDRFAYTDDLHYPLLDDTEGVSLERLSADRESDDPTNWHSAASTVGFATPGFENSQFNSALAEDVISVSPEVFSPDNDGLDDQLQISYDLGKAGFTGNIYVFDDAGRQRIHLVNNALLGNTGTFSWDGFDEENQKCAVGIYIVYFEAFHPDGSTIAEKKVATLGHFLD